MCMDFPVTERQLAHMRGSCRDARAVTRDEEERVATRHARCCKTRPGLAGSRRTPVAAASPSARERAGRGSVGPGEGSGKRGSPRRREPATAPACQSAARQPQMPGRPRARGFGRRSMYGAPGARSVRAGPRHRPVPRCGAGRRGIDHFWAWTATFEGSAESRADDTRAFHNVSRRLELAERPAASRFDTLSTPC